MLDLLHLGVREFDRARRQGRKVSAQLRANRLGRAPTVGAGLDDDGRAAHGVPTGIGAVRADYLPALGLDRDGAVLAQRDAAAVQERHVRPLPDGHDDAVGRDLEGAARDGLGPASPVGARFAQPVAHAFQRDDAAIRQDDALRGS